MGNKGAPGKSRMQRNELVQHTSCTKYCSDRTVDVKILNKEEKRTEDLAQKGRETFARKG